MPDSPQAFSPLQVLQQVFGYPDVLKLRSSMTLFAAVPGADPVFGEVLARYYDGEADARTLQGLGQGG